jgi:hypothetical protein
VKAILVMDMPSACKECPLRVSIDESICVKTLKDITDKEYFEEKPDWCPLKLIPSKKGNVIGTNYQRFVKGYNACIDEILGDKE